MSTLNVSRDVVAEGGSERGVNWHAVFLARNGRPGADRRNRLNSEGLRVRLKVVWIRSDGRVRSYPVCLTRVAAYTCG